MPSRILSAEATGYIEKKEPPQRDILFRLREIILRTAPDIKEWSWMGVPWYGRKFYLVAFRDHVNLGFSVEGLPEREKDYFEGRGHTMRHLKFHSLEEVEDARVAKLVRLVFEKTSQCEHEAHG